MLERANPVESWANWVWDWAAVPSGLKNNAPVVRKIHNFFCEVEDLLARYFGKRSIVEQAICLLCIDI